MIESILISAQTSPRSGLAENSPALQCWVRGGKNEDEPVKRATEDLVRSVNGQRLSPAARTQGGGERCIPSDKSLGYFRSSAARTMMMLIAFLYLAATLAAGQTPPQSPTPSPSSQEIKTPAIAVDYRADTKSPMPSLTRVGVDTNDQQPMSLREAIAMALQNNKDIEIARDSVKIAEFDLLTVRGAYDPKLTAQNYFEKINSPATSFLSGAARIETSDITATGRVEGLTPKGGGNYRVDFTSIRQTSNSQFSTLNPQYPTGLTFTYSQPLV